MAIVPEESASLRQFGQSANMAFALHTSYQLLSWNIFKSKKPSWQQAFSHLHQQYDLLLLQEAKIHFQEPINHYDQDYHWAFGESFAIDSCGSSCGVLTGSRIQSESAFNRHGPVAEPFLNTPKSSVFAYYPIAEHHLSLLVVNSHFINFRQTRAFVAQLKQVLDEIALHNGPVIFAGDFNTWHPARVKELSHSVAQLDLEQVHFENESRKFLRLDHIFIRGIDLLEAQILHHIPGSDHLPFHLKFQLFKPKPGHPSSIQNKSQT